MMPIYSLSLLIYLFCILVLSSCNQDVMNHTNFHHQQNPQHDHHIHRKDLHNLHHHLHSQFIRKVNLSHLPADYSEPDFNPRIFNPRGIRLGWVVNASPDYIKSYANDISALACYCAMYNIHFYLEPVLILEEKEDNRDYQQVKLKNVMKYLKYNDWLLVSDADIILLNYTQSVYHYIDDRFDVIMHERDITLEVDAGVYFVRNSPNGWEFLNHWYTVAPTGWAFNTDNGDLQELLQQYVLNDFTSRPCFHRRTMRAYQRGFLPCVMKEIIALRDSDKWKDNHYYYVLPTQNISIAIDNSTADHDGYIKIVRGFMGMYRKIEWVTNEDCEQENDRIKKQDCERWGRFMYGDFLGHGKGLVNYIDRAFIRCDLLEMKNISASSDPRLGYNRHDILMTPAKRWHDYEGSQKFAREIVRHSNHACPNYQPETGQC